MPETRTKKISKKGPGFIPIQNNKNDVRSLVLSGVEYKRITRAMLPM